MSELPVPLRFVPTLTDVVQPGSLAPAFAAAVSPSPANADFHAGVTTPLALSAAQEEAMVQRMLQRVDLVLDQRLQEVVDQLVQEHMQALVPRLRQEVGLLVRQCVAQAAGRETGQFPAPL